MALSADAVIAKARERAKDTHVFVHPDTGICMVVAHPGQQLNRDPQFLRENFGIMPQHGDHITTLDQAGHGHAPLTEQERRVDRAREEALRRRAEAEAAAAVEAALAELEAEAAAASKPSRKAAVEETPAKG